ncbi:hypothetical protein F2Q68_00010442 [Brassica cretica]|uniref:CCHC-type domain-containing protein n=1 Tax=Brassica cretica TaxID=69181 RepID=A0A8S9L038_BRACR|nr:hypothetical protein F2Q68_00010442 [Brassica cretica]
MRGTELTKVWSFASPILSIQPCSSGTQLRCGALLVPSCTFGFVQEELKSCPSQFQDCSLVSDCSYRTFDNDGDANSLVSVTLRREILTLLDGRSGQPAVVFCCPCNVRGRVKLEVSSLVHSISWSIPCSSGTQVLSKPVSRLIFRRETLKSFGRKERPTSGSILLSLQRDRIYFENLGSTIREHRPCHFRLSTIGGVTKVVRGRVKLEVSSLVHSISWFIPCSSGTQVLSKRVSRLIFSSLETVYCTTMQCRIVHTGHSTMMVTLRRETLKSFGRKERPTSGSILLSLQRDRIYVENLGSTFREHRPCHFRLSSIRGVTARLPVSVLYDEYQLAGAERRRPFYASPPRLTRVTPPAARTRPLPSRTVIGDSLLMGVRQRLFTELFLLHNQVRDMAAQCDLLIWQVRASARLELIKEWLEGRTECWDPEEEYRRHLLGSEGSDHHFGGCPQVDSRSAAESRVSASEAITSTCWDFVFCRSEAGHYRVPVLHAALCKKPLSDLEDAGVDPYFMDIEVDVVHDSPVHRDHPAAPASPATHIPPAPAAPIPAAQPEPAPTDPAIIALLELMAEMEAIAAERATSSNSAQPRRPSVPFQPQPHSAVQRGRGGRAFRGGRSGGPRPRTPTYVTCGQLVHVRRDCPNVGQFQPAVPSHITCFTCGERGHYATSCPRTHLAQPVVSSVRRVRPVSPPLLHLPPAKRQATAGRAYSLELPGPSRPPQGPISGTFLVGGISAHPFRFGSNT